MLVTFTTKAYADITLFGDVGLAILKMMGHGATAPGAILAADVPAALARLTAAIKAEKVSPPVEDKETDEAAVSIARCCCRRCWPPPVRVQRYVEMDARPRVALIYSVRGELVEP